MPGSGLEPGLLAGPQSFTRWPPPRNRLERSMELKNHTDSNGTRHTLKFT